ncbi:MAG: hypothetical protein HY558_07965, partial [Euryarchaeota archaeon]|nr:hypothetical protein [Euryarchaeota archaeon]
MAVEPAIALEKREVDLGAVLREGVLVWMGNRSLGEPFLLEGVLSLFAVGVVALVVLLPVLVESLARGGPVESAVAPEAWVGRLLGDPVRLVGAVVVGGGLVAVVSSYFTAGAIGMCRRALEGGGASLEEMARCGRRHLWGVLGVNVVVGVLVALGALLPLWGLTQYRGDLAGDMRGFLGAPAADRGSMLLGMVPRALGFIAGLGVWLVYALGVLLVFSLVNYEVVLGGRGPQGALR